MADINAVLTGCNLRNPVMKIFLYFIFLINTLLSNQAMAVCDVNLTLTKPDSIYSDHGDGTVTDKQTGLMWQKCALGLSGEKCASGTSLKFTWQAALAEANNNTSNGYSDWRLPNINELESLVDDVCYSAAINETMFPAMPWDYFWSASTHASEPRKAWKTDFANGYIAPSNKSFDNYVRLVRGNQ